MGAMEAKRLQTENLHNRLKANKLVQNRPQSLANEHRIYWLQIQSEHLRIHVLKRETSNFIGAFNMT